MSSTKRIIDICSLHPLISSQETWVLDLFEKLNNLKKFKIHEGELSVVLMTTQQIIQLHADYLDDPTPTDVITFPGDPSMQFAGEICVCVDVAKERAMEFENSFEEELKLYLIHGWLHLAGYKDETEEEIAAMRQAEEEILKSL